MDFGVRVYINLNILKDATPENRHGYLCKSFLYMLRSSLVQAIQESQNGKQEQDAPMKRIRAELKNQDEQLSDDVLFSIGIATRDLKYTSNALKYLACGS
eukprot:scaffold267092_cov47-Attheya_sp.AAC.1